MTNLPTIDIKGKEYVLVKDRVLYFNQTYPNGRIDTAISYENNLVRCKAIIHPDVSNLERFFVGHSEADRDQGMINKMSATENCETSAVGRALGMLGIGVLDSIASADEIVKAETTNKSKTTNTNDNQMKTCPICHKTHNGKHPKCLECWKGEITKK